MDAKDVLKDQVHVKPYSLPFVVRNDVCPYISSRIIFCYCDIEQCKPENFQVIHNS